MYDIGVRNHYCTLPVVVKYLLRKIEDFTNLIGLFKSIVVFLLIFDHNLLLFVSKKSRPQVSPLYFGGLLKYFTC